MKDLWRVLGGGLWAVIKSCLKRGGKRAGGGPISKVPSFGAMNGRVLSMELVSALQGLLLAMEGVWFLDMRNKLIFCIGSS